MNISSYPYKKQTRYFITYTQAEKIDYINKYKSLINEFWYNSKVGKSLSKWLYKTIEWIDLLYISYIK